MVLKKEALDSSIQKVSNQSRMVEVKIGNYRPFDLIKPIACPLNSPSIRIKRRRVARVKSKEVVVIGGREKLIVGMLIGE